MTLPGVEAVENGAANRNTALSRRTGTRATKMKPGTQSLLIGSVALILLGFGIGALALPSPGSSLEEWGVTLGIGAMLAACLVAAVGVASLALLHRGNPR
jgi:hypothetical protein